MDSTVGPVPFAAALVVLGVLMAVMPKYGWLFGLAIVFSAYYWAEDEARKAGGSGPIGDFSRFLGG